MDVALIHEHRQERHCVDNVCGADTRVVGLFTIPTCLDATTHKVLTAFFQLINHKINVE